MTSAPSSEAAPPGTSRQVTSHEDEKKAKAAVRAGVLAYFVDMFDIYLPVLVLLPAMGYFQATDMSAASASILSAAIFVATLIARPIGAALFGHLADTRGRKKMTLVAVAGFGVTTLLIACLPGFEAIGVWSIILLILLRFIDGIFLGGEYTTAIPLAMEWSPKHKRGLNGSLITSMSPAAYAVLGVFTLILLQSMPSSGVDSVYVQWGWRIPFAIGALLALGLFFFYLREVEEPKLKRGDSTSAKAPLVQLFTGKHRTSLFQVFVMMTGMWLITNMASAVLPGLLKRFVALSGTQTTVAMSIMSGVAVVAYIAFGVASQRIGRRRFFMLYGIAAAAVASTAFVLLMSFANRHGFAVTVALVVVMGLFTMCGQAVVASYLTERFPAEVRASGYGVGYSLALIIPAFYAFYLELISKAMPAQYAPAVLLVVGGLMLTWGAARGPETRDVDMGRIE